MNDKEMREFKAHAYKRLFFFAQLWFFLQVLAIVVGVYVKVHH